MFGPHLSYTNVISGHPEAAKVPGSGEGLCPFEPRLKGGTPLKPPRRVYVSAKARAKYRWFVYGFLNLFRFGSISP